MSVSVSFILIVLFFSIVFCSSTKHDVVVVLGCSDERILNERIDSAIQYIRSVSSPIILYVSGGIKHAIVNDISEASKENGLEFYNQNKFSKVVWVCKYKK